MGGYNFGGFHSNSTYQYKIDNTVYYWNICGGSKKCNNNNIALCSIDSNYNNIIYGERPHYTISKFKDGTKGGVIAYNTAMGGHSHNSNCTTFIKMYCAKSMPNTVVSLVKVPSSICDIEINMLGESACPYDIKNSYIIDKQVTIIAIVVIVFLCVLTIAAITLSILYIIDRKKKASMKSSVSSASYTRLLNVTPDGEDNQMNIQWK